MSLRKKHALSVDQIHEEPEVDVSVLIWQKDSKQEPSLSCQELGSGTPRWLSGPSPQERYDLIGKITNERNKSK